jgi:Na+-translocating ferredoxin:NAD+ oxidoreductase RnfG subunit
MAKAKNEAQLLNLLKSVLPKAVPDAKLAQQIYNALEKEIGASERSSCPICKRRASPR